MSNKPVTTTTAAAPAFDQAKYDHFRENEDNLSDAEYAEYEAMRAAKRKIGAEHRNAFNTVVDTIANQNLSIAQIYKKVIEGNSSLTIKSEDIFTPYEIVEAYNRVVAANGGNVPEPSKEKAPKEQKATRVVNVVPYLKSSINPEVTGVWRAHMPKFMDEEKAVDVWKAGDSIDQWLINPADQEKKMSILYFMSKNTGNKPNSKQLGAIAKADMETFTKTKEAEKAARDKAAADKKAAA